MATCTTLLRRYIRSVVYGGTDGIITIFAIVAGVSGASLPSSVLLILGLSTLIADALSMSVSDYVSGVADKEVAETERATKLKEFNEQPTNFIQELTAACVAKGFCKEDAEVMVLTLMKKPNVAIDMLAIFQDDMDAGKQTKPLISAGFTFLSFILFGLLPLLCDIILNLASISVNPFFTACFLTAFTLFGLGSAKAAIVGQEPIGGGIQLVTIGGCAALSAYFVAYTVAGVSS